MLHGLQLLGVADRAAIDPFPVTGAPGFDLLDVGICLALLAAEVSHLGLGSAEFRGHVGATLGERDQSSMLRQVLQPVGELIEPSVDRLQVEQLELGERIGFQRLLLMRG
ncbi:MAG: hypothetical protein WAK18_12160 [Nocardioidaceae bacterium]